MSSMIKATSLCMKIDAPSMKLFEVESYIFYNNVFHFVLIVSPKFTKIHWPIHDSPKVTTGQVSHTKHCL